MNNKELKIKSEEAIHEDNEKKYLVYMSRLDGRISREDEIIELIKRMYDDSEIDMDSTTLNVLIKQIKESG